MNKTCICVSFIAKGECLHTGEKVRFYSDRSPKTLKTQSKSRDSSPPSRKKPPPRFPKPLEEIEAYRRMLSAREYEEGDHA